MLVTPSPEPSAQSPIPPIRAESRRQTWIWLIKPCVWLLIAIFSASMHGCADESGDLPALSVPERAADPATSKPKPRPRSKNAVTYTIARGGTLINVANLYKIHHHEIIELNPEIEPERQLEPDTEVVVYDRLHEDSESVGLPHDGDLVGAVPMPNGPGRIITAERWKTWATRSVVEQLDHVLRQWAKRYRKAPPVLVGNLSARRGGPLSPHKTHQSGRDADLSYVAKWDGRSRVTWQKMNAANLDRDRTWALLKLLVKQADVEVIFVDRRIQHLLLAHARKSGVIHKDDLKRWLEVAPGAKRGTTLLRHVAGHDDHLHVRFSCSSAEKRCRS